MLDLIDGISFLLLAMATFALSEALMAVLQAEVEGRPGARAGRAEESRLDEAVERGGQGDGAGDGPLLGARLLYRRAAGGGRDHRLLPCLWRGAAAGRPGQGQAEFGKGSIRGLAAPETANNAACSGSFVPLLTLGIPGSGTTAIMLGALLSYGIQPGPRLFVDNPEVFWSVIISMYIGNIILLVLNLPLIPYIARVLALPSSGAGPLHPVLLADRGLFRLLQHLRHSLMVLFAIAALVLRLLDFPMAPMLLGFILGGMMEENLRRALIISNDSWSFLWERPLTASILAIAILILFVPILSPYLSRRKKQIDARSGGEGG
jgi:putative tricarboxylic transport membrane protein